MAILGKDGARYPSLQAFQSFALKDRNYAPSFTNLFSFHIGSPTILRSTEQLGVGTDSTIGQTSIFIYSNLEGIQPKCRYLYIYIYIYQKFQHNTWEIFSSFNDE